MYVSLPYQGETAQLSGIQWGPFELQDPIEFISHNENIPMILNGDDADDNDDDNDNDTEEANPSQEIETTLYEEEEDDDE